LKVQGLGNDDAMQEKAENSCSLLSTFGEIGFEKWYQAISLLLTSHNSLFIVQLANNDSGSIFIHAQQESPPRRITLLFNISPNAR